MKHASGLEDLPLPTCQFQHSPHATPRYPTLSSLSFPTFRTRHIRYAAILSSVFGDASAAKAIAASKAAANKRKRDGKDSVFSNAGEGQLPVGDSLGRRLGAPWWWWWSKRFATVCC